MSSQNINFLEVVAITDFDYSSFEHIRDYQYDLVLGISNVKIMDDVLIENLSKLKNLENIDFHPDFNQSLDKLIPIMPLLPKLQKIRVSGKCDLENCNEVIKEKLIIDHTDYNPYV